MPRFLAIVNAPGITEAQFRNALDQVRKWRIDPRHTILRASCILSQGRIVLECDGPEQAPLEKWLQERGWQAEVIHKVDLVHDGGYIWKV
ncbi:MAG: hypothetical protein NZ951_05905 [Dehalococcoidia bacterium]|nr:hypothetical protein [Dehalococcoidia bacterium]MDW8119924.1 hypothetical protein [Chloroflexota bacterium]